jgi:carboxyvinyl-carboxyphosphonate phosphorylmutase
VPVVDVLTARLAQEAGWGICKLNSSSMKATNFGLPDEVEGIVTMSDYADVIRRIRRTVHDVAVLVDADDCGGTPETVTRWVSDMEAAGVSGVEIEDRGYLPLSEAGKGRVAAVHPIDVQVANLRAAVEARNDPSTVIIARTCAFSPTMVDNVGMPIEEQRERVRAYAETGVDAIMIPGAPGTLRQDIQTVHGVTDLPQMVLRMPADLIQDKELLAENNVRIRYVSQSTVFGQIVPFVYDIMKRLKEDEDGVLAMSEEDALYGDPRRQHASALGKGTTAALTLITTPRFRHEFVN